MVPATSEPCYEQDGTFCRWVYERTGESEELATLASWFVDRPLTVLLIVLVAWILIRLARRWVGRAVNQIVNPSKATTAGLKALRLDRLETPPDPAIAIRREARTASITAVLTSTIVVVVWSVAFMLVLAQFDINLGPLIASAGIAGVALGFGAQSLVKDCIAGLFMLIEDQYGVGDVVDLGEATGVVDEITLRVTVLRSLDGTVWHVPNGVVQRVGNLSQLWSVALVDVDVAYDTDLERARELLELAATEVCAREEFADDILEPPTVLGVEVLGADGITLRLTAKVQPGRQWGLQRAIREHVKAVYDREGVEIPFPQRTIWVKSDGPPADDPRPDHGARADDGVPSPEQATADRRDADGVDDAADDTDDDADGAAGGDQDGHPA